MEQNAQDVNVPEGEDMGVAYEMTVLARRYYKKGVKQNENRMLLEMVVVREGDKTIGRVAADLVGGGFVISDDRNEEQWHISAKQLWDNYLKMRSNVAEIDK